MQPQRYRLCVAMSLQCPVDCNSREGKNVAKRTGTQRTDAPRPAAGLRPRPDVVHSSVYLPEAVYEALREIAFKEHSKIHDVVMEGIGLVLRKRGYPSVEDFKAGRQR